MDTGKRLLGQWLKKRREEFGLTLKRVAVDIGVSITLIHNVESGKQEVVTERLSDFARAYMVDRRLLTTLWLIARLGDEGMQQDDIVWFLRGATINQPGGDAGDFATLRPADRAPNGADSVRALGERREEANGLTRDFLHRLFRAISRNREPEEGSIELIRVH